MKETAGLGGGSSGRLAQLVFALAALFAASAPVLAGSQPKLSGNLFIHDPSIIVVDGCYVSFATGTVKDEGMPRTKSSPDGMVWSDTGPIPGGLPDWIPQELGYTPPDIWAPSVSERDGTYYLYYSASRFGYNDSVIGLMTNKSFDAGHPAEGWVDQGLIVRSRPTDDFNAIDPFRIDTADGRAWLAFGSAWSGIQLSELDPATGMLLKGAERHRLAARPSGVIEAPGILLHDGRYYLFVSFDQCCRGEASSYRIMVGRADAITGPYLDRDGKPMLEGAATPLLATSGRVAGPGGQEPFRSGGEEMLVYHFYDRANFGMPTLQVAPLRWDADGWPYLDPMP